MIRLIKPEFWKSYNYISLSLIPFSLLYGLIVVFKQAIARPKKVRKPVICIGNLVLGGSGKTPVVMTIASYLKEKIKVGIISRGFKGKLSCREEVVKIGNDSTPSEVGDEALLLAGYADTYICMDRAKAAERAIEEGAHLIIMDDGLQNTSLYHDLNILVIDANYFLGNGLMLPAGPLREPLYLALKKSHCIIFNGEKKQNYNLKVSIPVFFANSEIADAEVFRKQKYIVLCGIGNPDKFLQNLEELEVKILEKFIFEDHYLYSRKEIETIYILSERLGVKVITTAKDFVKIPQEFKNRFVVAELKVTLPKEFYNFLDKNLNLITS